MIRQRPFYNRKSKKPKEPTHVVKITRKSEIPVANTSIKAEKSETPVVKSPFVDKNFILSRQKKILVLNENEKNRETPSIKGKVLFPENITLEETVLSSAQIYNEMTIESVQKINIIKNEKIDQDAEYVGPGGKTTTLHGLEFEKKTSAKDYLLKQGFKKITDMFRVNKRYIKCEYLRKEVLGKKILFFEKLNFNFYSLHFFGIKCFRIPDELYMVIGPLEQKPTLKILEKKYQRVPGSVDQKLGLGNFFKFEYREMYKDKFNIEYSFCVNDFLKKMIISTSPKFTILDEYMCINNNNVFFGDDKDYYIKLYSWITDSMPKKNNCKKIKSN